MPRPRRCRRSTRRSSTSKNPSTYGAHQVATGPYMIKNDATGNSATRPASASRSCATRTGTRHGLPARPTSTRSTSGGRRRPDVAGAPGPRRPEPGCCDIDAAAGAGAQAASRSKKDQLTSSPRRLPLRRAQHDDQAVRQRQRPQGASSRRLRPRRAAARRAAARSSARSPTHFIPPGIRGLRGGRRRQGPGRRLHARTRRATWRVADEVHEGGGLPVAASTPAATTLLMVGAERRPGARTQAEVGQGAARRSWASRSSSAGAAGRDVHEVLPASPKRRSRSARPWAGSRTSPTRSRCWIRRSTATNILPQRQHQLVAAQRPEIDNADGRREALAERRRALPRRGPRSTRRSPARRPAIPYIWDKQRSIAFQGRPAASTNAYIDALGPRVHLDQVGHDPHHAHRPAPLAAAARGPPVHTSHGPLHHPPTALGDRAAVRGHRGSRSSSSTCCRPPTRRCCARAASRRRSSSRRSASSFGLDKPLYEQYWNYMKRRRSSTSTSATSYQQRRRRPPADPRPPARPRSS